jgi:hypothetical protein
MPYSTQFHLVVPSPGSVVINSANSLVPAGAFVQESCGEEPVPSHVSPRPSALPAVPAALVNAKLEVGAAGVAETLVDAAPVPAEFVAVTEQL